VSTVESCRAPGGGREAELAAAHRSRTDGRSGVPWLSPLPALPARADDRHSQPVGFAMAARHRLEVPVTVLLVVTAVTVGVVKYRASEPRTTRTTAPATAPSTLPPGTSLPDAGAIAVVGDSLSVQATDKERQELEAAGWRSVVVDAQLGRRINVESPRPPTSGMTAVRAIRAAHDDPLTWVIALGTNDAPMIGDDAAALKRPIEAMLDEIGPGHRIVWVNVYHAPRPEAAETFNRVLDAVARRAGVVVADWASRAWYDGYVVPDGVHLTTAGIVAYASMIADAAQRALQLPPGLLRVANLSAPAA
jgi:GDSL-like lipase/acylhydrolase family protein